MARGWDSFFVAQVGASAALTGLVFVALSINLERIIGFPHLVDRAGEAVIVLVQPVLVGLAVLVPEIATRTTGILCTIVAVVGFVLINRFLLKARTTTEDRPRYEIRTRAVLAEIAVLPSLVGGITLLAGSTAGYYWIALGAATAIFVGIFDAWILLVEILR